MNCPIQEKGSEDGENRVIPSPAPSQTPVEAARCQHKLANRCALTAFANTNSLQSDPLSRQLNRHWKVTHGRSQTKTVDRDATYCQKSGGHQSGKASWLLCVKTKPFHMKLLSSSPATLTTLPLPPLPTSL